MKLFKLAAWLLAGTVFGAMAPALMAQDASAPAAETHMPWMNTQLPADRRADLLLARMTLDEKIAMLHGPMAMPIGPFKLPEGAIGSAGYIPGNKRLGIPALQESDASLGVTNPMMVRGPTDMSTPLPSGLALAATFNPQIAYAGGAMIGTEARAKGINVMLAGGVNLARDPRGGRNFEFVGEDPLLAGTMAGESVRGIQAQGVISTVKHFALNDQEDHRMVVNAVIDESAARESDLLAFEIAIERGQPGSIMCAYNEVGGVYACQNDWLLNKVLKQDWGYKGYVMSDWGAVHSLGAFTAGLDQQSGEQIDQQIWFGKPLKQAVTDGKIPAARVNDATHRILRSMFAAGLFDQPAIGKPIDFAAHARVAQTEAEEGIVLLDNRKGLLPLAASVKSIAVIGGNADAGVPSGGGSSQVTTPWHDPAQKVRAVPFGGEGMMAGWNQTVFDPSPPLAELRARMKQAQVHFDNGIYPARAARIAKQADVAIVFVYQPSSEGEDVPDMSLPFGQDALIEAVAAANPNTIVVLETGNPVLMPWADKVGAVLEGWYGGARGGAAIARVLTGEVNPSGRLPISWPVDAAQLPRPVIPGAGTPLTAPVNVDYNIEGADVGYRWYAHKGETPRYWFGHGLSYTHFGYADLAVTGGKALSARVTVTNSGKRPGKDVVQLYLTGLPSGPARRLLGFTKVDLAPGQSKQVTLNADPRLLARFDEKAGAWKVAAGRYRVGIGADAGTMLLSADVTMAPTRIKP